MTPLLAFASIALALAAMMVIASIVSTAARSLSRTLHSRREAAQLDRQGETAKHGPVAHPRRAVRRRRREPRALRRARRY